MQTVVELDDYVRAAKQSGMSEDDNERVIAAIAADPEIGVAIAGGARKIRIAGRGKGKSGGYRVVYFFAENDLPIFLITVFGKGEKDNLTIKEKNALAGMTNRLRETYRRR